MSTADIYLSLDVGDVRIGVAISRSGVIAEPLEIVQRTGRKQVLNRIEEIVRSNQVTRCVVGLPTLPDGREGEQAEKTRAFVRSLTRRLPQLAFEFWDERYSSIDADDIAHTTGNTGRYKDHIAAAVILTQYLDKQHQPQKKKEDKEGT